MPKGRPKQSGRGRSASRDTNKMDAVREALAVLGLDAKPLQICARLKKAGIDISTNMASNYKSTILKKAAETSSTIRVPTAVRAPAGPVRRPASPSVSLEDVQAVKELTDRIGTDNVLQLAEVLAS